MGTDISWIIEYKYQNDWYPVNGSYYADDYTVKSYKDYPNHPYFKGKNIIPSKLTARNYNLFADLKIVFNSEIPKNISEYTKTIFETEESAIIYKGYITGNKFLKIKEKLNEESHYWPDIMLDVFLKRTYHIIPPIIFSEEELHHYYGPKHHCIEFESHHQMIDIEIKRQKLKEIEKKIYPLNKNPENWRIFIYYTC